MERCTAERKRPLASSVRLVSLKLPWYAAGWGPSPSSRPLKQVQCTPNCVLYHVQQYHRPDCAHLAESIVLYDMRYVKPSLPPSQGQILLSLVPLKGYLRKGVDSRACPALLVPYRESPWVDWSAPWIYHVPRRISPSKFPLDSFIYYYPLLLLFRPTPTKHLLRSL